MNTIVTSAAHAALIAEAEAAGPVTGTYRTAATTQGAVDGSLSAQWASRPADQRFLSLAELRDATFGWAAESAEKTVAPGAIRVVPTGDFDLTLDVDGQACDPTHFGFDQVASLAAVPSRYLRSGIPAKLAAACLGYGLKARGADGKTVMPYIRTPAEGAATLRAVTSEKYGRVRDYEVVDLVSKLTEGTSFKVPGMLNWASNNGVTVEYNPFVDVTKETTTLYASDRDVCIFLCDDLHPIEIGKLSNGEPDLLFRGFMVTNSETGAKTFSFRTMMLRGVCQNRNLWGTQDVKELTIRHNLNAWDRFQENAPVALGEYTEAGTAGILTAVKAAKAKIIAVDDEERLDFLCGRRLKLTREEAEKSMQAHLDEEDRPIESVWDVINGVTAYARRIQHQDDRVMLEARAGKLMQLVAA